MQHLICHSALCEVTILSLFHYLKLMIVQLSFAETIGKNFS